MKPRKRDHIVPLRKKRHKRDHGRAARGHRYMIRDPAIPARYAKLPWAEARRRQRKAAKTRRVNRVLDQIVSVIHRNTASDDNGGFDVYSATNEIRAILERVL